VSTEQVDPQIGPEASEQELRAAYEAEMQRLTSADMLLQATVSLLNIGGYRLGLAAPGTEAEPHEGVRDLEQVRDAIDGAKALLPILERRLPQELRPLRDALSQLQMAYAREAGGQTPPAQPGGSAPAAGTEQAPAPGAPEADAGTGPAAQPTQSGPGPAQSSGRLWVPGR
jgi:hypothetical protein